MVKRHHLTVSTGRVDHLHVRRRVSSFDVRVDGFFHQTSVKLSLSEMTPHRTVSTALRKLIRAI